MTLNTVSMTVSGAAAILAALFYIGRRLLRGLEAFLLGLVPVIQALGEVREAWRKVRSPSPAADETEEQPRALP